MIRFSHIVNDVEATCHVVERLSVVSLSRNNRRCAIDDSTALPNIHIDPLSPEVLERLATLVPTGGALSRPARLRALGALIGGAVGDALGAPFEFGPAGQYTRRFPEPVLGGVGEMVGGGGFGWEPGEFTDDTQMAVVLAEALLRAGGFDPDAVFAAWQEWADTATDVGITTRAALSSPTWVGAAEVVHLGSGRTAANGALMRTFPLALVASSLAEPLGSWAAVMLARAQSALTHHDPAAGWGAAIAVETMRQLIHGAPFEAAIEAALALLPSEQREVFDDLLSATWTPSHHEAPSNGSVWGCLAQAVWAVRRHERFEDVLHRVIDLGGDTDTVACVAGAIAGARDGLQAIPSRWTTYTHGTAPVDGVDRRYDYADLQDLGRRLLGASPAAPAASETLAGPTEVAPGVYAASLPGAARHVAEGGDDLAVLSLCRTDGAFNAVAVRREVYVIDQSGDHNPRLDAVVIDAVDTMDAWLAEGRKVLVHCHGGRSRTGLVLLAWAMRRNGWDHGTAEDWIRDVWPRYADWNSDFVEFLSSSWPDLD